jgi:hypothetical protein
MTWVVEMLRAIEELYSARFASDTTMLKARVEDDEQAIEENTVAFPQSVAMYLNEKLKTKAVAHQRAADLVRSVETLRKECLAVELFGKFLGEVYSTRELIFFLYTRAQIEKEMDLRFTNLVEAKSKRKPSTRREIGVQRRGQAPRPQHALPRAEP